VWRGGTLKALERQIWSSATQPIARRDFLDDLNGCTRMAYEGWKRRGLWARAQEFLASFLQEQA
jgi:hypothetical protein